jgi:3-oxocholest-4-en-26-oyl-CoA dehydrogenase alpha subunit
MHFALTAEQDEFRKDVVNFVERHWSSEQTDESDHSAKAWEKQLEFKRQLARKGWLTLAWPKNWGGLEASPIQQAVFNEVMGYHGAPSMDMGADRVGPTIMMVGNDDQKREFLPGIVSGDVQWCQGFSEPNAGSDLANLQTRARIDGDNFVLDGQKIWTSNAHRADWMMLLVRSDPDAPKHRGISVLLVPLDLPGLTTRPLVNMAGAHSFNEVFFDNVHVPRRYLLGEMNRGWYVAAATLDFERSGIFRIAPARRILEKSLAYLRTMSSVSDPVRSAIRTRLADLFIDYEIGVTLAYRVAWLQEHGHLPNHEASISKAFGSEMQQRLANLVVSLLGLRGQAVKVPDSSSLSYRAMDYYLSTSALTIAGGTSEIQRNITATRGLGLPRG